MHSTLAEASLRDSSYSPDNPLVTNHDYLQVMSPNLDGIGFATTISRTVTVHRQDIETARATAIPVPDGSIYDGSNEPRSAIQDTLVPNLVGTAEQRSAIQDPHVLSIEQRNVRRRTSPTSIVPSARQPDTPQRAVLRTELAGKDESIAILRQQLSGIQTLARNELQAQRNTFGTMADFYKQQAREVAREEVQATDDLSRDHAAELAQLRILPRVEFLSGQSPSNPLGIPSITRDLRSG